MINTRTFFFFSTCSVGQESETEVRETNTSCPPLLEQIDQVSSVFFRDITPLNASICHIPQPCRHCIHCIFEKCVDFFPKFFSHNEVFGPSSFPCCDQNECADPGKIFSLIYCRSSKLLRYTCGELVSGIAQTLKEVWSSVVRLF